jgi:hypothetical protein
MKTRIFHTAYWGDEEILELAALVKYLHVYLMLNEHVGLTGIYKLSRKILKLETSLSDEQINKALIQLEKEKRVFTHESWIYVTNTEKFNRYQEGKKTKIGFLRELESIPDDVKKMFQERYPIDRVWIGYTYSYHTPRKQKTENRNKKKDESVREGTKKNKTEQAKEFIDKFNAMTNGKEFKVTDTIVTKLQKRLEKYSMEEIVRASQIMLKNNFMTGDNEGKVWYATPSYILRDDDKINEWLNKTVDESKTSRGIVLDEKTLQILNQ